MAFRPMTPVRSVLLGLTIAGAMTGASGPASAQYYLDDEPYGYSPGYGYRERYIPARPIPRVTERDIGRIATRDFGLTQVERLIRTGGSYVVDGRDLSGTKRRLIFDAGSGELRDQVVLQPTRPAAPQLARVAPREPQRAAAPALVPHPPERPPELKGPAQASAPATVIPPSPAAPPAPEAVPVPPKEEPATASAPATQPPETPGVPKPEETKPAEAPQLVEPKPAEPRQEPKPPVAAAPEAPAVEAKPEVATPEPVKPAVPADTTLPPFAPTE